MSTPQEIVERLVRETRAAAEGSDPVSLRQAFERVLAELRVEPEERSAWADGADVLGDA